MAVRIEDGRVSNGATPELTPVRITPVTRIKSLTTPNGDHPEVSALFSNGTAPKEFPVRNSDPFTERSYYEGLPDDLADYLHESAAFFSGDPSSLITISEAITQLSETTGIEKRFIGGVIKRIDGYLTELEPSDGSEQPDALDRTDYMALSIFLWTGQDDVPYRVSELDHTAIEEISDNRLALLGDHPLAALYSSYDSPAEQRVAASVDGQHTVFNGADAAATPAGLPTHEPHGAYGNGRVSSTEMEQQTPPTGSLKEWDASKLRAVYSRLAYGIEIDNTRMPEYVRNFILRVAYPGAEAWTSDALEGGVLRLLGHLNQFPDVENLDDLRNKILQLQQDRVVSSNGHT